MNCAKVRNRLLALEDSRIPPEGELRTHLGTCRPCRTWARGLARLDAALTDLPVPPRTTAARDRFLADFESTPVLPFAGAANRPAGKFWFRWSAGVAAGVLVALGAVVLYRAWPTSEAVPVVRKPADPLLAKLMRRHSDLMTAHDPAERLEQLRLLAGDLRDQSRELVHVAEPEQLGDLAGWYEHVVRGGVMTQARQIPTRERQALRTVADELATTSRQMEGTADTAPVASVVHLRRIARAAREGDQFLRGLMEGA